MWMEMQKKSVLLISMPFAGINIPSIQLSILETYLKKRNVSVETRNLYLKAAEIYGLINYNLLINPPNDSYIAQMAFSKFVFEDHWNKVESKCKDYFEHKIKKDSKIEFSFEDYISKTEEFYNWTVNNIDWSTYDLIGFTLNYGQLLPSLAIAKKIKEKFPDKQIVFGGSRTAGEMGENTLKSFNYIDFIVSGDGEESLFLLSKNTDILSVPNLIYRDEKGNVGKNPSEIVDMNGSPLPLYDTFYNDLSAVHQDIQQFFFYFGKLPVEISRGCWWNRCSFCNLNLQHCTYREKKVDKIIEELEFLSEKYKMLDFQIIGNTLLKNDYQLLCEKIIELDKDFSFFVEARAGQLKNSDYSLLKKAGFNEIQTGIESLSSHYLKTMNKGVRVIDNIAALKFCQEKGIKNRYNFVVNYPNEEKIDFNETVEVLNEIKNYIDPAHLCNLRVFYASLIYKHPEKYNIKKFKSTYLDELMFPKKYLKEGFNFVYDYECIKNKEKNDWEKLVDDWKKQRRNQINLSLKTERTIDELVFYYADGGNFIKIFDKRNSENINIYSLNQIEREVFLLCTNVISYDDLQECLNIPDYKLAAILHSFEESKIVFREKDCYLSLPLKYKSTLQGPFEFNNSKSQALECKTVYSA